MRILLNIFIALLITVPTFAADWDFSKRSIDVDEILSGGPPKDGIPALDNPKFIAGKKANFMRADEQVLGTVISGIARAYPTRILSWHELVNDKFGDTAVLVSW